MYILTLFSNLIKIKSLCVELWDFFPRMYVLRRNLSCIFSFKKMIIWERRKTHKTSYTEDYNKSRINSCANINHVIFVILKALISYETYKSNFQSCLYLYEFFGKKIQNSEMCYFLVLEIKGILIYPSVFFLTKMKQIRNYPQFWEEKNWYPPTCQNFGIMVPSIFIWACTLPSTNSHFA